MDKPNFTPPADVEKAVELFRSFITDTFDLNSLAVELDELQTEYGRLLIDNEECGVKGRSDRFYILHDLKCICSLRDNRGAL